MNALNPELRHYGCGSALHYFAERMGKAEHIQKAGEMLVEFLSWQ